MNNKERAEDIVQQQLWDCNDATKESLVYKVRFWHDVEIVSEAMDEAEKRGFLKARDRAAEAVVDWVAHEDCEHGLIQKIQSLQPDGKM